MNTDLRELRSCYQRLLSAGWKRQHYYTYILHTNYKQKYYSLLPPILAYMWLTTLFIICLFPDLNSTSFPVIFSLTARLCSWEGTNVPISPLLTLYLGCFFLNKMSLTKILSGNKVPNLPFIYTWKKVAFWK